MATPALSRLPAASRPPAVPLRSGGHAAGAHRAPSAADSAALLRELGLPEHAPVEQLRALARIAAALCRVATAVVNLLDDCFQHQVGEVGFVGGTTPRTGSMCVAALVDPALRHVPDASREPAFADSPWVDGRLAAVRFYASAPLVLSDGRVLGSLCVFSLEPGLLDEAQQGALVDLAAQAVFLIEEARRARESAQQAALFRLVAEGSADVLSRHQTDGSVLYVSPSLEAVLGWDPADEFGAADRVHVEDRARMGDALARVVDGSSPDALVTVRSAHADGSWRWMEVRLAPIRDAAGRVLEVHSAARDVTARVQAQKQLAQVGEQTRGLVDSCADALVGIDEHGLLVDWNPAAETTFGWSAQEAVGRELPDLIVPPELRDRYRLALAGMVAGKPGSILGRQVEIVGQHRDGSRLPLELTVWRSPWEDGWRYNAFLRDVTERAQASRALAAARDDAERRAALTEAVLETIDVGVVACTASGRLSLFNAAAQAFHGGTEDPGLDPALWAERYSLLDEDGEALLRAEQVPLTRALREGELQDVTMVIAPDGLPARTVRCDGRAMHDGAGRLLGAVVTMKDVTESRARARELVAARDQALASTRAKTAFLAAASHEIRTPLNGVLGTLELLSLEPLTARQSEYVQVAAQSGEALLQLLNDVLDLSKAETTALVLASETFRPSVLVGEVVLALRPLASRKGLSLGLEVADDELLVGDPARLRQVLMNLVGNAVKFTERGRVTVQVDVRAAGPDSRLLRLVVRDTGQGLDDADLNGLFQPFVQGTQGQRYGGTGLGLALTQQVVDLMGGRITVASEPGRGSCFSVEVELRRVVPVQAVPAPSSLGASSPGGNAPRRAPGTGSALRVLVVDDSEVNLMVAQSLLETEGVDVTTTQEGHDAVRLVRAGAFDLVLLDNRMPGMSGVEAARAIRALPDDAGRTRLVALTASAAEAEREQFAQAGMQGVLTKPVRLEDLRRALTEAGAHRTCP